MIIKLLNQVEPNTLAVQKAIDDGWNQHLNQSSPRSGGTFAGPHPLAAGCDVQTGEPMLLLTWPDTGQLENSFAVDSNGDVSNVRPRNSKVTLS